MGGASRALCGTAPAPRAVVSRLVCKLLEAGFGPALVGVVKDRVEDAVGAGLVDETGHRVGAPPHLAELALDHVGGAHHLAMCLGQCEELQQGLEVLTEAGDR